VSAARFLTILTSRNLPKIWQPREPEPSIINKKTVSDFTRPVDQTGILEPARQPPKLASRTSDGHALTRQKKITFGEMRAADVRGPLIYCSDLQVQSLDHDERGRMAGPSSGCPISSRFSLAKFVPREEPMSGAGKKRPEGFPRSRIRIWSQAQDRTSEGGRTFRGKKCNH
jgi:hypothetical protein